VIRQPSHRKSPHHAAGVFTRLVCGVLLMVCGLTGCAQTHPFQRADQSDGSAATDPVAAGQGGGEPGTSGEPDNSGEPAEVGLAFDRLRAELTQVRPFVPQQSQDAAVVKTGQRDTMHRGDDWSPEIPIAGPEKMNFAGSASFRR
jgi:hypothetical protein